MIASFKDWIESTLLEQDRTAFEKIGPQRLMLKITHRAYPSFLAPCIGRSW